MSEGGPYHITREPVSRREYLVEYHGEAIADAAERARYGYSDEGHGYLYLRADSIIPRPERVSIEGVFPIDVEALAAPSTQHRGLASWTRFLQWSPQIQDNDTAVTERDYSDPAKHFDSKAPRLVGKRYDDLRDTYFPDGEPRPGALADLRSLKDVARGSLQLWARQVGSVLEALRKVMPVLFLELWRAIDTEPETPWRDLPEERRNRLDSLEALFVSRWRDAIFGASRTWAIGSDITSWSWGWGEAPEVIFELQGPRIIRLWDERDVFIDEALPVELQRVACETVLAKIARAEGELPQAEPPSEEDAEEKLPAREDLDVQSLEARRDVFDLYDLLNEPGNLEREWMSQIEIYSDLAERRIKRKPKDLSKIAFIKKESQNLRRAVDRTLRHKGKENILEKGSKSTPQKEKRVAKNICDWIFELASGSAPTWKVREPFT